MNQRKMAVSLLWLTAVTMAVVAVGCKSTEPPPPPTAHLDGLRDEIRDQIDDPGLESDMLAEVDRMQNTIEGIGKVISGHHEALLELYRDYDSTRADIERELRVYNAAREDAVGWFADAHFALKTLSPADAWPKIAKAEDEAIAAMASVTIVDVPGLED